MLNFISALRCPDEKRLSEIIESDSKISAKNFKVELAPARVTLGVTTFLG